MGGFSAVHTFSSEHTGWIWLCRHLSLHERIQVDLQSDGFNNYTSDFENAVPNQAIKLHMTEAFLSSAADILGFDYEAK